MMSTVIDVLESQSEEQEIWFKTSLPLGRTKEEFGGIGRKPEIKILKKGPNNS